MSDQISDYESNQIANLFRKPLTAQDRAGQASQRSANRLEQASDNQAVVLQRAVGIEQLQEENKLGSLGTDSDTIRGLVGGITKGAGSIIEGLGFGLERSAANQAEFTNEFGDRLAENAGIDSAPINPQGETLLTDAIQKFGKNRVSAGERIRNSRDISTQVALEGSQIQGDVTKLFSKKGREEVNFGSAPSVKGYATQGLDILSEFIPTAVSLLVPGAGGVVTGAVLGGAQAGSSQGNEAEKYIMDMDEKGLRQNSQAYNQIRNNDPNLTHEEAQKRVAGAAKEAAFKVGGTIGGAGGAATNFILKGLQKKLATTATGRVLGTTALSGVEEGSQEVAETVGSRYAANRAAGTKRDITKDTLGDAILGGSFGAGIGAAGGAVGAVKNRAKKQVEEALDNNKATDNIAKDIGKAVAEKRFSDLSDPQKSTEYPVKAAAVALNEAIVDKNNSEVEKQEAADNLSKLEEQTNSELDEVNEIVEDPNKYYESKIAEQQKVIDGANGILKQDSVTPEQVEQFGSLVESAEQTIEGYKENQKNLDTKEIKSRQSELQAEVALFKDLRKVAVTRSEETTNEELINTVNDASATTEVKDSSIDEITSKAVLDPESITDSQLDKLASNPQLSTAQKEKLRQLTEQRVLENQIKDAGQVGKDIFSNNPSTGFKSIQDYRSEIADAVKSGDSVAAQRSLSSLEAFAKDHALKAQVAQEALSKAGAGQPQLQLLADRTPGKPKWTYKLKGRTPDAIVRRNGGIVIHQGTAGLVSHIQSEADLLNSTVAELNKALSQSVSPSPKKQVSTKTETNLSNKPVEERQAKQQGVVQKVRNKINEDKSLPVKEVIALVESHGSNLHKGVVRKLAKLPAIQNLKNIEGTTETRTFNGVTAKTTGLYDPNTKTLSIDANTVEDTKEGAKHLLDTIVHELVHAATYDAIVTDSKLSSELKSINSDIKAWLAIDGNREKLDNPDDIEYAIANEQELLASTLGSSSVAKDLAKIPASADSNMLNEFMSRLVQAIKRLVPLSNQEISMLERILLEGQPLLTPTVSTTPKQSVSQRELQEDLLADRLAQEDTQDVYEPPISQSEVSPVAETDSDLDAQIAALQEETSVVEIEENTFSFENIEQDTIVGSLSVEQLQSVNRVAAFFKNSKKTPISKVNNFIGTVMNAATNDISVLDEFTNGGSKRVEKFLDKAVQPERFIKGLVAHSKAWNASMDKLFKPKNKGYEWQAPMNFFLDENGKIDQSIKDAISVAAYNFITENNNNLWYNYNESDQRSVLNLDEHEEIPSHQARAIFDIGKRQTSIIQELGQAAYQATGLKLLDSSPQNEQALIEGPLGSMALALLMDSGYVQRNSLPATFFDPEANKNELHHFIRSNRQVDENGKPIDNDKLTKLKEVAEGNQGFLNDVFGVEYKKTLPSLKPVKSKQKYAKGTKQTVSKEQLGLLNQANSKGYYVKDRLIGENGLLNRMPDSVIEAMAGVVDTEVTPVHAVNIKGVNGKNEALRLEIAKMREHVSDVLEGDTSKPAYIEHVAWKQFRVGQNSAGLNPQNSKFHRALSVIEDWNVDIDINDGTNLDEFSLAVMEALPDFAGVKTDGAPPKEVLKSFPNMFENDTLMTAVNIVRGMIEDPNKTFSQADGEALALAVSEGGENTHSFLGIEALAQYAIALDGDGKFTSDLMREGDGKNNGPMISLIQMGMSGDTEADAKLAGMGGFYLEGSQFNNYAQYAQQTGLDLYKYIAKAASKYMQEDKNQNPNKHASYELVSSIMGNIVDDVGKVTPAGRNATKNPVTTVIFGAGMKSTIDGMAETFIEKFYKKLEKNHNNASELKDIRNKLNDFLPMDQQITEDQMDAPLELELTNGQREMLKNVFKDTFGAGTQKAIESRFENLLSVRKDMNEAVNMMSRMYKAVYDVKKAEMQESIAREIEANGGTAIRETKGRSYRSDLSKLQQAELDAEMASMFPAIQTYFSKREGGTGGGLAAIKTKKTAAKTQAYKTESDFNNLRIPTKDGFKIVKSMAAKGLETEFTDPGVGLPVMATHSMDSFGNMAGYAHHNVLNNHDAVTGSMTQTPKVMTDMNAALIDAINNYSIPEEIMKALFNTMAEFEKNKSGISAEVMAGIAPKQKVAEGEVPKTYSQMANRYLVTANRAHKNKLNIVSKLGTVDQYYMEGGKHTPTAETIAKLVERAKSEDIISSIHPNGLKDDGKKEAVVTKPVEEEAFVNNYLKNMNKNIASDRKRKEEAKFEFTSTDLSALAKINAAIGKTGTIKGAINSVFSTASKRAEWERKMQNNQAIHDMAPKFKKLRTYIGLPKLGSNPQNSKGSASPALDFTTQEVFDAFNITNPSKQATKLKAVLENITSKLYGPVGTREAYVKSKVGETPVELAARLTVEGDFVFSSKANGAGLGLTASESFALEQIEIITRESLDGSSAANKEIVRVYKEARNRVHSDGRDFHTGDWSKASKLEKSVAQRKRDFIFKTNGDSNTNHISRFVALAHVYQPLVKAMDFGFKTNTKLSTDLNKPGEIIESGFRALLQWVSDQLNGTRSGENTNQRLNKVVNKLVYNEQRRRLELERKPNQLGEQLEEVVSTGAEKLRKAVSDAGRSSFVQDRDHKYSGIIKATGSVAADIADDTLDQTFKQLEAWRNDQYKNKPLGLVLSVINEGRGQTKETTVLYDLLSKMNIIEQERKHIIDNVSDEVIKQFANHTSISKSEKAAITQIFLRSDLGALTGDYSMNQIISMVQNPERLDVEINNLIDTIKEVGGRYTNDYLTDAADLAYFLATNNNTSQHLLKNAHNIAYQHGLGIKVDKQKAAIAEPIIDNLVSLMALQYTPQSILAQGSRVIERETARGDKSGINYLLNMHSKLKQDALDSLFQGNPVLMSKGYTRELYNPYNTVVAANKVDAVKLVAEGYVKVHDVPKDSADPDNNRPKALYVLRGVGMQSFETGMIANTGMRAKGTTLDSAKSITDPDAVLNYKASRVNSTKQSKLELRHKQRKQFDRTYDPSKRKGGALVPVLNGLGEVSNYQYIMTHDNKDTVMERDNSFENIIANTASNQFDKLESGKHNKDVIGALHEFFSKDYAGNSSAYVEVSLKSGSPAMRDAYRLLPEQTKQVIRDTWGADRMFVRNDLLDMVMGYRSLSLADPFGKDPKTRNIAQKALVNVLERIYGKAAVTKVRKAEDMWKETVKLVKDILVIRNLHTMIGNILSNTTTLLWHGVSLKSMAQGHREAIDGLMRYQEDKNNLTRLKSHIGAGGNQAQLVQKIADLEYAIKHNPVNELVDEGMFQTIQEDIDLSSKDAVFSSPFDTAINKQLDRLPKGVRAVGEHAFVGQDTPLYKILSKSTQMSDFVARYVLFDHITKRSNKEVPREEAIKTVREAFVNYDVPSHQYLHYTNIMGLTMFTKYFIRTQKIIMGLSRSNPARGLMLLLAEQHIRNMPTILDSNMLSNGISNPIDDGAFSIFGAIDEPIPIKVLLGLFD